MAKKPQAVIMTKEQSRAAKKAAESPTVDQTVENTFEPNAKAYVPVQNGKYFDLWTVLINTETGEVEIEVEPTKAASIQAAYQILQVKYTNDLLLTKSKKGGK